MPTLLTILLAWTATSVVVCLPLARLMATLAQHEPALAPGPIRRDRSRR